MGLLSRGSSILLTMEWLRKGPSHLHIASPNTDGLTLWWQEVSVHIEEGSLIISGDLNKNLNSSEHNRMDVLKFFEHASEFRLLQILEGGLVQALRKYVVKMRPTDAILRLSANDELYRYQLIKIPGSIEGTFNLAFIKDK